MSFVELVDLASVRLGAKALAANDEFFAAKENLLKPGRGIFIEHKFTSRGKWMDGWETRRRRTPGHDWCIVRLGLRGIIQGVNVDTNHFLGNYPEECSLDACDSSPAVSAKLLNSGQAHWTEILPRKRLRGGAENLFAVDSLHPWTHVRLNIYPDGGVARLRVHGDVVPNWERLLKPSRDVDLAALDHGGFVLAASDMFFGSRQNLIWPGRAKNMGEGWETQRRRGPGYDWAIVRLSRPGEVRRVEIDTNHFKGNYPDSFSLEGCHAPGGALEALTQGSAAWSAILPQLKLGPDRVHRFQKEVQSKGPFSHVRLNIFPDGGISRMRVYGRFVAA